MSRPPARRPPRRNGRIVRRRVVALVVVLAVLAALGWGAARIAADVRGADSETTRAQPSTAAPRRRLARPLRIVFPEGFTRDEMAERIGAVNAIARRKRHVRTRLSPAAYRRVTQRSSFARRFPGSNGRRSLEGFLFPALYEFTPRTTTRQLVDDQVAAFSREWGRVGLGYARSRNLTPYDVLIIASMIEKETVAPHERRLVAAVIYNRLRRRMPLGIDATIRYGLGVPATQPLRASQLESDNPYNTRNRPGLPPTPIANPGLASMRAAAHPASVDYLYFVRKPDHRTHFFTASEQAFYRKACEYGYGCR